MRRVAGDEAIAIGTATDPYQPAERRFGRTRAILEVFAGETGRLHLHHHEVRPGGAGYPAACRNRAAQRGQREHHRHDARRGPGAAARAARAAPGPAPGHRRRLAEAGIPTGVFPNPIMPWITDTRGSLELLAAAAREAGASYFGGGPLFLMPCAQKVFFPFLDRRFPNLAPRYRKLYEASAYLHGPYKEQLRRRIQAIRERHGLGAGPSTTGRKPKPSSSASSEVRKYLRHGCEADTTHFPKIRAFNAASVYNSNLPAFSPIATL